MDYQNITAEKLAEIQAPSREQYTCNIGAALFEVNAERIRNEHRGEWFGVIFRLDDPLNHKPKFYFSPDGKTLNNMVRREKADGENGLIGRVDDFYASRTGLGGSG